MNKEIRIDPNDPTGVLIVTPERTVPEEVEKTTLDDLLKQFNDLENRKSVCLEAIEIAEQQITGKTDEITAIESEQKTLQTQIDNARSIGVKTTFEIEQTLPKE